jgi:hypothetical protein
MSIQRSRRVAFRQVDRSRPPSRASTGCSSRSSARTPAPTTTIRGRRVFARYDRDSGG